MTFERDITIGEKYRPAMEITDQHEADLYFEACVQHCMSFGRTREEAERIERSNLGYYSSYYDNETMVRVQNLFRCVHPIFGKAEPGKYVPAEVALAAGKEANMKRFYTYTNVTFRGGRMRKRNFCRRGVAYYCRAWRENGTPKCEFFRKRSADDPNVCYHEIDYACTNASAQRAARSRRRKRP